MIRYLSIAFVFAFCSNSALAFNGIDYTDQGPTIALSADTLEAVDSGVSLTFICEFAVVRRWLFLDWPEQRITHRFVISKHALSDRYLVHQDDKPTPAIFRSTSQGMAHIAKSAQLLFRGYKSDNPKVEMRLFLNKYDLPAPIRLSAFMSSQWNFDSGWNKWPSAN